MENSNHHTVDFECLAHIAPCIDTMDSMTAIFNPKPAIKTVCLENGATVIVIDDALNRPERILELAADVQNEFVHIPQNPFPGYQLMMPTEFSERMDEFFRIHIRSLLNGRRSLHMYSRLSKVALAPSALDARQRICHRDNAGLAPGQTISAAVLYLFKDPALGGTVFFEPKIGSEKLEQLVYDACNMPAEEFESCYGLKPAYMTEDNQYFKVIGRVEAKWNRIIFYDGQIFHSSDITNPSALNEAQGMGRLTVNGFFTCTRRAA